MVVSLAKALEASVARFSQQMRVWYTERQLYFEVCRTLQPVRKPWVGRLFPLALAPAVSYSRFADRLRAYISSKGVPPGLIQGPLGQPLPLEGREPDLTDYGCPRVLICQHEDIARMLLANNCHSEFSCVILGLNDAAPLPDPVCAMLARCEDAVLYLLHDASLRGLALAIRHRELLRVPHEFRSAALGLRPSHAMRMGLCVTRTSPGWLNRPVCIPGLAPEEQAFLTAGWESELSSVSPPDLLRMLNNAIIRDKASF
jgi:hypothetical protein